MCDNDGFIKISVKRHDEIIKQLKDYERSLINIYQYMRFREDPTEPVIDELHSILTKYIGE